MLKRVKNLVFKYRIHLVGVFCLGLIWDIFFNLQILDLAVLILGILWILTIFNFRLEPKISFILAAITYGVSFIFQFFSQERIMEKGASWFFVFLLIGFFQSIIINFFGNGKKT